MNNIKKTLFTHKKIIAYFLITLLVVNLFSTISASNGFDMVYADEPETSVSVEVKNVEATGKKAVVITYKRLEENASDNVYFYRIVKKDDIEIEKGIFELSAQVATETFDTDGQYQVFYEVLETNSVPNPEPAAADLTKVPTVPTEALLLDNTAPVVEVTKDATETDTFHIKITDKNLKTCDLQYIRWTTTTDNPTETEPTKKSIDLASMTHDGNEIYETSININAGFFDDENGEYVNFKVVAIDDAGNKTETAIENYSLLIDTTEPEIVIKVGDDVQNEQGEQDEQNKKYYKVDSKQINIEVKDLQLDDSENALTLNVKKKCEESDSYEPVTISASWEMDSMNPYAKTISFVVSGEGKYEIEVKAKDKCSPNQLEATKTIHFVLDKTAPVIEPADILKYADGTPLPELKDGTKYYLNKNAEIDFYVKEYNYETANITITKNGTDSQSTMASTEDHIIESYAIEGNYTYNITAKDKAGNENSSCVNFVIDKTAPVFTLSDLTSPSVHRENKTLTITAEDANLDLSKTTIIVKREYLNGFVETKTVTWNAVKANPSGNDNSAYTWEVDEETSTNTKEILCLNLTSDGKYTVTISGKDKAGNEGTLKTMSFCVDTTPPKVTMSDDIENGKHYNMPVTLSGTIEELNINSTTAVLHVKRILALSPTVDSAESVYTKNLSININNPNSPSFSYNFADEGKYIIWLDVNDGVSNSSSTGYNEGVGPNDNFGLRENKAITFCIDKTAPGLSINGIGEGGYEKNRVNITYKAIDRHHDFSKYNITVRRTSIDGLDETTTELYHSEGQWERSEYTATKSVAYTKEGNYTITFEAEDQAGNTSRVEKHFTIDRTAPVISHVTYADTNGTILPKYNTIFSNKVIAVEFNVHDSVSGYNEDKVYVKVGSQPASVLPFYIAHRLAGERFVVYIPTDLSLPEFSENLTIYAEDKAGNTGRLLSNKVIYTTDYAKITMDCDMDYTKWTNQDVTFHVNVKDHYAGISKITYKINNKVVKTVEFDSFVGEYQYDLTATETASVVSGYAMEVEVINNCGTTSSLSRQVYIDKVKPTVQLSGITEGTHYNSNKRIDTKVGDVSYTGTRTVYHIKRSLDGVTVPVSSAVFYSRGYTDNNAFTMLEDGTYEIYAVTTDSAGNSTMSNTLRFVIDKTAPVLNISGVSRGSMSGKPVTLTFSCIESYYDTNKITIRAERTLDGKTSAYNAGSLVGTAKHSTSSHTFLQDGTYRVIITATDRAGNIAAQQEITFSVDMTKPDVKINGTTNYQMWDEAPDITFLVEESYYSGNKVSITGTRTDILGNEKEILLPDFINRGKISMLTQAIEEDGIYELKIVSVDEAGNSSEQEIHFTVDKTAPVIYGASEFDGNYLQEFQLSDTLDNIFEDLTVISYKMLLNGIEYNGTSKITDEGKYNLYIEAEDELGHKTIENIEFIIDHTAPKVIFTGVADGGTVYQKGDIILSLTNTEDEITSVRMNGVDYGAATRILEYTEYGSYQIDVDCRDRAGNEITRSIFFVYANPIMIGIIIGSVSVLCLSTVIWVWIRLRRRKRMERE